MKKLLAILLAVALVATLSISAVMTASAGSEPKIEVSSATATKGSTVSITVKLVNNPGLASMKLKVAFPEGLTFNGPVDYNIVTSGGGQATQPQADKETGVFKSPVTLNWVSPFADVTGDHTFATLSFTVAEDATEGDKEISVSYNADDVYNLAEENITFATEAGKITVVSCLHANTTEVAAVASTCITAGHAAYTKCDDCGAVISGSDAALPLDATNHEGDTEVRDAKPASCSEKGYTGDTYCKACSTMITKGQDIDTTAHTEASTWSYDANNHWKICTACEWIFENTVAAHSGGTATCTKKAVCSVCGQEYGELDSSNHTAASEWSSDSSGHWKACTACGGVAVAAESHDFEEKVLKEATTEAAGSKANVCKVCGYTDEQSITEIPKLITYDVSGADGKKDGDKVVFDGSDAEDVSITAAFPKSKFTGVKVNGKEVPSDAYELAEDEQGNTKVVFKDEYLNTLGNGDVVIEILADDGVATYNITVKNSAAAGGNSASGTGTSPVTGDSDIFFLVVLLLAVMAVSVFTGYTYRRRKEND